ncbi:T9SS type A sorting domain-containing protein [Saccharicrinis sp. 156]|uniref:T9SS type A sorting domain-containing protein n=1 Tax=Saccharicrinis sp. 156 TaxID=3417574 RepID=UPI003D358BF4
MKKSINLLSVQLVLYLCFLPSYITAQNLWTGSLVIGNWDNYQSLDGASFNNATIGDILKITATDIDMSSAQLSLNNGSWVDLAGSGMVDLRTENYSFVITSVMLTELQSNGVLVRGKNYTLTSVDLIPGDGNYELNNAVWLGETVIGNWEGYQAICAGTFVNAQVGNLLRVKVSNVEQGAQGHLSNSSWGDLIDAEAYVELSGLSYYEFTITSSMLAELQSNGVLVRGANYTIKGIYVIDPLTTQVDRYFELSAVNYRVKDRYLSLEGLQKGGLVSIYNLNGKKIHEIDIYNSFLNVQLENKGLYIIEIRSGNSRYANKILVE